MKNIKLLLILFSLLFAAYSCDDEDKFIAEPESSATVLEVDIDVIELDRDNTSNPALTLFWSEAEYTQQTPINYRIELSSDEAFTNPFPADIINGDNSITWSVSQLNTAVASAGLPPFEWNDLFIRVKSFLGTGEGGVSSTTSNIVSVNLYPYYNYPFKDLFLVGPACASGWDNNNNNPVMFRNSIDSNIFTYTGFFNGGQPLKVLETRGSWAPQYGEGDPGTLVLRATEADDDPSAINDIESLSDGYYRFEVNLDELTFSVASYNESGSTTYSSITMQGSALTSEVAMTQSTFDPHFWQVPSTALSIGDFQFSVDGTIWGNDTEFSGNATVGGGEIPVGVADDYEIWFNDLTGDYHLIPINLSQS